MKKNIGYAHAGYSIIISVMLIGFLLILTTGTLSLVFQEMQDGKGKQDYLKASAAAEASLEIALGEVKQKGYGYYNKRENIDILGVSAKDGEMSYDFDGKVSTFSGKLPAYGTDIVPLFWIDENAVLFSLSSLSLTAPNNLVWNIIGSESGISGTGSFNDSTIVGEKKIDVVSGNPDFTYSASQTIKGFLDTNTGSYLVLYNPTDFQQDYSLQSNTGEYFTKPRVVIESSGKVGKYTQNLKTVVDNTEFLGILKYSIFSGE